jgi:glutathionyl-hydroquinone reductase
VPRSAPEGMVMPSMPQPTSTGGFVRHQGTFTGRITGDGSSGFLAEPGRYQLYASLACPWSQRALIVRSLLGLDRVIGLTLTDPISGEHGWRFPDSQGGMDPVTGARFLSELYLVTDPAYQGKCTLPMLWDIQTQRIISNDMAQITIMFETEFTGYHRPGSPNLYPAELRRDIDAIATLIYHAVNIGVYKAGLAATQAEYEEAFDALFATMDALDERLARRRFLLGSQMCEADVRLFPTLARFDAVYYTLFKCNLHRLIDYQHLWGYARDLYQQPGFGDTTDFDQIKRHYYQTQSWVNPSRIVPKGPFINWLEPHGRDRIAG